MSQRSMTRRQFCGSVLASAAGMVLASRTGSEAPRPPNILLITTDDQGAHAGCYGDPFAHTPNLDSLAGDGMLFTNGYVTQASCSPSRSSIFTGLYPHQNGQIGLSHRGYSMHQGLPTLPALLKQAGYFTGSIGKIHVRPSGAVPFDWRGVSHAATRDVRTVPPSAREFLKTADDRPFFLMVNYVDPHRPLLHHKGGIPADPYGPEDVLPFDFLAGADTEQLRDKVAGYYNCVRRIDAGVGMLLEELQRAGHGDDTLVLFIGDHGPPFARAKTTCYEAGLRIPFIMRWPGIVPAASVSDALVSTVDILPTFVRAAGMDPPDGLAGRSLLPLMHGPDADWRNTLCAEYTSHCRPHFYPRRSIRDSRYKLILNLLSDRRNPVAGLPGFGAAQQPEYDNTVTRRVMDRFANPPHIELYDLQRDPDELYNLAGDDQYAQVQQKLLQGLDRWRNATQDPLINPEKLAALTREHDEARAPNN